MYQLKRNEKLDNTLHIQEHQQEMLPIMHRKISKSYLIAIFISKKTQKNDCISNLNCKKYTHRMDATSWRCNVSISMRKSEIYNYKHN